MRILFQNGIIITKDDKDTVYNRGWIIINNDKIESLGAGEYQNKSMVKEINQIIDLHGNILIPGLINCHTHFSQSLLKGFSENILLEDWLNRIIRPFQHKLTVEQMELASRLCITENIHFGVTTIVQHQKIYKPNYVNSSLQIAKDYGIRMSLMFGCNNDAVRYYNGLNKLLDHILHIKTLWESEYISIGFGPTSVANCSKDLLVSIHRVGLKNNMPLHVHVSETQTERKDSIIKNGMPPIMYLSKIGVLDEHTQLVHCIWIDGKEMLIIKDVGSSVVNCPISNLFLRSGMTRINEMLANKIPVVIGSDGSASGISQDILGNLKVLSLIFDLSQDNLATSASKALYMVTNHAAKMLGA